MIICVLLYWWYALLALAYLGICWLTRRTRVELCGCTVRVLGGVGKTVPEQQAGGWHRQPLQQAPRPWQGPNSVPATPQGQAEQGSVQGQQKEKQCGAWGGQRQEVGETNIRPRPATNSIVIPPPMHCSTYWSHWSKFIQYIFQKVVEFLYFQKLHWHGNSSTVAALQPYLWDGLHQVVCCISIAKEKSEWCKNPQTAAGVEKIQRDQRDAVEQQQDAGRDKHQPSRDKYQNLGSLVNIHSMFQWHFQD